MSTLTDRIYTDDAGIWRQGNGSTRLVISWDDIYRVTGGTIDGITKLYWTVELDWTYGEYAEFSNETEGFSQFLREIGMRLADEPDWEERLLNLGRGDRYIVFWKKPP